jgi:DNA end-binding protein Ku
MAERAEELEATPGGRPHWSGTISFGLVSIPVALLPATRPDAIALRMLAPDGTPLARRYVCTKDGKALDDKEIIRGYEVREGRYVLVTDEELERLEPRKSRDIELREFVPRESIDPMLVERAYFLAPAGSSTKAYRLLAATLERSGRAGIATFVMRDHEYLIAIAAERGILRGDILRFPDELRTPADVGLPRRAKASAREVARFGRLIEDMTAGGIPSRELEDRYAERLLALVKRKRARREDVVRVATRRAERVVDLAEVLKQSLGGRPPRTGSRRGTRARKRAA